MTCQASVNTQQVGERVLSSSLSMPPEDIDCRINELRAKRDQVLSDLSNCPFSQDVQTCWLQGTCAEPPTQVWPGGLGRELARAALETPSSRHSTTADSCRCHEYSDWTHPKGICLRLWPLDWDLVCRADSALWNLKLIQFQGFYLRKRTQNLVQEFLIKFSTHLLCKLAVSLLGINPREG